MKRSPILIFLLVIGTMISAMLLFIQSPRFARVAKSLVAKYLPQDLGIEGDFSELSVKFFPPGVSLINPKLTVRPHNVANLPPGSSVEARRLDLNFQLFQAFTGKIRVAEVVVVDGDVKLIFDRTTFEKKSPKKTAPIDFHWDELLQIRAEAVALRNTKLEVELRGLGKGGDGRVELLAKSVRVGQWEGQGGVGYELELEIEGAKAEIPGLQLPGKRFRIPTDIDKVRGSVHVNPLGLQLDELFVSASGIEVLGTGTMKGNLLYPKAVTFQGNVQGSASLTQVLEAFIPDSSADGRVEFKGAVHGNLDRIEETLRAEGTVRGTELRFENWHADTLKVDGSWKASPGGGELSITNGMVASREYSRLPPARGASGGKIEFGSVKVNFPLGVDQQPLAVPITFDRAHAHWLGAGVLKDVFPLDFRISGPMKVTYRPGGPAPRPAPGETRPVPRTPRPWEVEVALSNLSAIEFQLDNQRLGHVKPLRRVLKVPRIILDGLVKVDASGIRPEGLSVELPRAASGGAEGRQTKFKLNGKVDFKSGYDFQAIGPVNLADLGEIAENPIRGEGTLALRVHGPSSRAFLDFDCDLANTSYLGLDLGALKGRITWDDDPSHLIFTDVRLRKGDTSYRGDGKLDLGNANSVNLAFQIPQGDIQDLIQIFSVLTQDLWWFPRALSGPTTGSVQVAGGIATKDLKITGRLTGTDWEYGGERFQRVAMSGGFDRGRYYVSDFRTIKRRGSLQGRISAGPDKEIEWDLKTQDLTVSDLDHVARLDVPIRGKLAIASSGKGREGAITSTTEGSLTSFAVRGVPMPASSGVIRSQNGVAELRANALGGQGILEVDYDFKPGGRGMIRGEGKHLDFSPILLLLNPRAIQDRSLAGLISGSAELRFRTDEADRATGKVEFTEYLLQKSGATFRLARPVSLRVTEGSFDLQGASIRGTQSEAFLNLRSIRGALDGQVSGDIDIGVAEFVTSAIGRSTGAAELDFKIGGTMRAPSFVGKATIADASVQMASFESPFENINGVFQLRQNVVYVQGLEADLAGGRVEADGTIEVFATQWPQIKLKGTIAGSKLKVYPFQFAHVKTGNLTLKGEAAPYMVEGTAIVDSALSKEKVFNQRGQGEGLKAIQYMPPVGPQSKGGYPLFKLNIDVRAERGILIQNDLFDAEAKGHVTVVNTIEAPRVLGTAELLPGSRMLFKDRSFLIQSASATFDNPTVINPAFSLSATTEINRIKINLFAAGRLAGSDQWKIELSSNPVLPQSELLSLLALGITSNDSKRLSSSDRSLVEQGEAASLLLQSLDFNREVRNRTGIEVQLDEATNTQVGTSIFRPQSQNESTAAPRIVIRRKIGSRMELSAKSTVGVGASNQREVNAELKVTPGLSVIGVWDYRETVDAQKNTSTFNGSYGLDLKVQKRFK